jgi:two-component system, cell cycle response regulator DivK
MRRVRKKVLVVENDRISRDLATRVLEAGGYDVVCAHDGGEALLVAAEVHPDLVLMDIGLPGIDGIEVAEALYANPKTARIPVLVWSALVFSADRERARHAGCVGYLTKPVRARELLERVDEAVGLNRQLV